MFSKRASAKGHSVADLCSRLTAFRKAKQDRLPKYSNICHLDRVTYVREIWEDRPAESGETKTSSRRSAGYSLSYLWGYLPLVPGRQLKIAAIYATGL